MAESSQGPFLREVPFHCVAEARKLPAWTPPPPRGRSAGRGAAWSAAALTFTNFHRGASWGKSVNSGTRKGRPEPDKPDTHKRGVAALRTQKRARGASGFSGTPGGTGGGSRTSAARP